MASSNIPIEFIRNRFKLCWSDVFEGIQQGWLDRRAAIDLAVEYARSEEHSDSDEMELAGLLAGEEDKVSSIVERLACKGPSRDENKTRLLWMRVILAWVYENLDLYEDPLGIVEGVYADFGYPEEIRNLVRYNEPTDGYRPQDHSEAENTQRLMELWHDYLEAYAPQSNTDR